MVGNARVVEDMREVARVFRDMGGSTSESVGWTTRGRSSDMNVRAVLAHHTAAPVDITNMLIDGRFDLPGPLCNWELRKSGLVVLIASGRANHAGVGVLPNNESLGIEATGPIPLDNTGPDAFPQYTWYVRLVAAHCIHYGWPPDLAHAPGHKETARPEGRKVNPAFNMSTFRVHVANAITAYREGSLVAVDEAFIEDQARRIVRWVDHGDPDVTGSANNLAQVRADIGSSRTALNAKLDTVLMGLQQLDVDLDELLARPPAEFTPQQIEFVVSQIGPAVVAAVQASDLIDNEDAQEIATAVRTQFVQGLTSLALPPD
jgi:hypothetical protein